jgi:hypothetical protein
VTIFAVGADINQLSEFRDVFGMRYVGLVDSGSSVYNEYRVPNPTAPYPQDYIIDQQGVIRYWSDQFDPKEVIATIDRLLATGAGEGSTQYALRPTLRTGQNPARGAVRLSAGRQGAGQMVGVCDRTGRLVARLRLDADGSASWDAQVPAGVYFFRLASVPGSAALVVTR